MIFFGAVNIGTAYRRIGLPPFLIGLGYLMIWKLEGKKNVPPPPPGPSVLRPWSSLDMRTLSREFFPMTISTRSASLCSGTNRAYAGCSATCAPDISLADDLAQEAFLRAYKNIRSFRGETRFPLGFTGSLTILFARSTQMKELVGV